MHIGEAIVLLGESRKDSIDIGMGVGAHNGESVVAPFIKSIDLGVAYILQLDKPSTCQN